MHWYEHWKAFDGYEQSRLIDPLIGRIRNENDPTKLVGEVAIRQVGFLSDYNTQRHGWIGKIRLCQVEKIESGLKITIRVRVEMFTQMGLIISPWHQPEDDMETKIEIILSTDSVETKTLWRVNTNLGEFELTQRIQKQGEELIKWPRGRWWERIYPYQGESHV